MHTSAKVFGLVLVFSALACNKSEPSAPVVAQSAEPLALAKPAAPTPSVEDNTFKLALTSDADLQAGAPLSLGLILEARGGYHVNEEYPLKVELSAPSAVKLDKSVLAKSDAAELDAQKVRFALPFTADKGRHAVSAEVDFAVCTAETCIPDQRTVTLTLDVK